MLLTIFAPNAFISSCFSKLNFSGTQNYFILWLIAASASPIPVFPAVGSMIVPPFAASRFERHPAAVLSLVDPLHFLQDYKYSSFAKNRTPCFNENWLNFNQQAYSQLTHGHFEKLRKNLLPFAELYDS